MAEEVEMTPVEAGEPPKADPLAKPASPVSAAAQAAPAIHKPVVGAAPSAGGLKPGLKLPTQNAALKPGLKLPTQNALKPGVRLPQKPVIRKPGSTVLAVPLPKPVSAAKPVAVDAQGIGKLPTVEAKTVPRADAAPVVSENPNPLEALKSVTQKLKGITQEIPQQAILRKTGIIADGAMSDAQKEAAKHKTARISLSDAMGVAPVKNENAPIKTIRIKRPVDIPGSTKPLKPQPPAAAESAPAAAEPAVQDTSAATATQRKTLKITRPGGAVRPSGKFGIKRPGSAPASSASSVSAESGDGAIADIPEISDIPDMSAAPMPVRAASSDGPAWLWTLSAIVQLAACAVVGALAWFLYTNTATSYF
ncbi:MAG: hypothetical protein IJH50_01970 [Kiritimatiellae bacterium]|nr:hypothetical protein [Kiritimatiellia bacterium]